MENIFYTVELMLLLFLIYYVEICTTTLIFT